MNHVFPTILEAGMTRMILGMALIVALGGCAQTGESPDKMIEAAKAVDKQFIEAYNKGDVDGVMETYWKSPDFVSFPPGMLESKGWEGSRRSMVKEFEATPGGQLELFDENYTVAGEYVVTWGKWRYTAPGMPEPAVGRFTDIKGKRNGKWVYIHDHASLPMGPPPSPH